MHRYDVGSILLKDKKKRSILIDLVILNQLSNHKFFGYSRQEEPSSRHTLHDECGGHTLVDRVTQIQRNREVCQTIGQAGNFSSFSCFLSTAAFPPRIFIARGTAMNLCTRCDDSTNLFPSQQCDSHDLLVEFSTLRFFVHSLASMTHAHLDLRVLGWLLQLFSRFFLGFLEVHIFRIDKIDVSQLFQPYRASVFQNPLLFFSSLSCF